jgi:hypothetical protein
MAKVLSKIGYRPVKYFRHWRSKKLIFAEAYGKKCFWIKTKK